MENSLKSKVKEWIESQGYPLEMLVAREFLVNKFAVDQSALYADPETGEAREIDVVAIKWSADPRPTHSWKLRVSWHIECKSSKDKPWVVTILEDEKDQYRLSVLTAIYSQSCILFLAKGIARRWVEEAFRDNPLLSPRRVGTGLRRANLGKPHDNDDQAYKAVMSATKSAAAAARLFDNIEEQREKAERPITDNGSSSIAFPTIVVDSPIFEYSLNAQGEFTLVERELSWALCRNLEPFRLTPVPVVSKNYLPTFTKLASDASNYLCNAWLEDHT
jgi:hypothetical protein